MPFDEVYRRQVELLVRTIPYVAEEECFALKGGTAINLFIRDLPRLSVDIDLTFLPLKDRDQSLAEIENSLRRIGVRIKSAMKDISITEIAHDYERNFLGMTEVNVAMETLLTARTTLVKDITAYMPENHKYFLVSFYRRKPEWSLLGLDGLDQLPAVRWRELNLDKAGEETRADLVRKLKPVLWQ